MIRRIKDMDHILTYSVWYNSLSDNTMCLLAKTVDYATAVALACMRWSYSKNDEEVIVYNELSDSIVWECITPMHVSHASGVYNLPVEIVENGEVQQHE